MSRGVALGWAEKQLLVYGGVGSDTAPTEETDRVRRHTNSCFAAQIEAGEGIR